MERQIITFIERQPRFNDRVVCVLRSWKCVWAGKRRHAGALAEFCGSYKLLKERHTTFNSLSSQPLDLQA